MKKEVLYHKLKASAYHFLFSLIIVVLAAYVIFYIWYPSPFYQLFAVFEIFLLLLVIDLILGPLCTFIIYNQQKKSLKMDIAIILLIQMMAFSWGMWNIAQARPAWLVLFYDTIYVVSPSLLRDEKDQSIQLPTNKQNFGKPKLVMLKPEIDILATKENDNSGAVQLRPDNFIDYSHEQALMKKLPLTNIKHHNENLYQQIINNYPNTIGYFPVITESSMKLSIALVNQQGDVERIILAE